MLINVLRIFHSETFHYSRNFEIKAAVTRTRFHLKTQRYCYVSTSCLHANNEDDHESANIWIHVRNSKWIDLNTQRYQNWTIWKHTRVTQAWNLLEEYKFNFISNF